MVLMYTMKNYYKAISPQIKLAGCVMRSSMFVPTLLMLCVTMEALVNQLSITSLATVLPTTLEISAST